MADLKSDKEAFALFEKLKENSALNEKFEVQTYQFDADFLPSDSIDFKGKQSNIYAVAKNLKNIYKNQTYLKMTISTYHTIRLHWGREQL